MVKFNKPNTQQKELKKFSINSKINEEKKRGLILQTKLNINQLNHALQTLHRQVVFWK